MSAYNNLWPVNNEISLGDIQPNMGMNRTTGDIGTGTSDAGGMLTPTAMSAAPSGNAKPVTWWLVMIVLFIGLIFSARHLHGESGFASEFKQIRPSIFNILIIGLVVLIGLPLIKVGAQFIPNESLRNYVLAV